MVRRGAQGRPWALAQIAHELFEGPKPEIPTGAALAGSGGGHYEAMLQFYGVDLGLRVARKHLGWYMDTAGTRPALRRAILTARDSNDVKRLLPQAMVDPERQAA